MFSTKLTFAPHVKEISLIVALLYVYPFATADIYYADDIVRTLSGGFGWTELGRPLSNLIFYIIGFSSGRIVDISPLPQIASVILLTMSAWYYSSSVYGKVSLAGVVFSSPLLLNPFFLQNLAYKYDSITMAAGVFLTTMAFVIHNYNIRSHVLSGALLVASLCLYQPVVNVFIGMIAVSVLKDVAANGNAFKNLAIRSAIFCSSYAVYTFCIAPIFSTTSRSELAVGQGSIKHIEGNVSSLIENISALFNHGALYSYIPLFAAAIFGLAALAHRSGWRNIFLITLSTIVALVSVCGPLFLLKNFGFVPRVLVGFSGFALYIFYCVSVLQQQGKAFKLISITLGVYNILLCFSICYSFVNAQKSQIEYESHTLYAIANKIIKDRSVGTSVILGTFNSSSFNRTQQKTFPVISKLVLNSYDWTNYMRLKNIGIERISFRYNRSEMQDWLAESCQASRKEIVDEGNYTLLKTESRSFFFVGNMKDYRCK
ncbi:glucosyltransferase domain-containing protein [Cronobacter sp. JZ38]|uniref:glucosyltransferase domain-containing protein n=1 Tax=Cronobacter sp. JZ38 TaxID=1906275 RepID=UPI0012A0D7CF|nr:glucosyltransferase domain-containing protein [Cronobacter sp. JZ38]